MTRVLTMALLLAAGLSTSACWESEKEEADRRASEFMRDFGKCGDCDKPFKPFRDAGKPEAAR